jgi:hypothetical protein
VKKMGKDVPVKGLGSPYGWEPWRLPHFLDNPLTDGGEVASLEYVNKIRDFLFTIYLGQLKGKFAAEMYLL